MKLNFKYLLVYYMLVCLSFQVHGDGKNALLIKRAETAFRLYQFDHARKLYKKLYHKTDSREVKAHSAFRVGHCYLRNSIFRKAESWYRRSLRLGYQKPEVFVQLIYSLKSQGKYTEVKKELSFFKAEYPGLVNGEKELTALDSAMSWSSSSPVHVVEKAREFNSKFNDYAPAYFKDDMVFTSDRENKNYHKTYLWTGLPFSNIYLSSFDKRKEKFDKPEMLKYLNTPMNDGVVCFNSRFTQMYFTQCNGENGDLRHCRIMVSQRRGKVWTEPLALAFCKDSFTNYGQPSLSPDGKKLYFSSNMTGGFGELREDGKAMKTTDIYVVSKVGRGNTWSDPVNLGEPINTAGQEQFPYAAGNTTLYFSSNGHAGLGGLDIFKSEKEELEWQAPENLQYPINSPADDFGIILEKGSGKYKGYNGYFSSNREVNRGDDIYSFYCMPISFDLHGIVFNALNNKPLSNANLSLELAFLDTVIELQTDSLGYYEVEELMPDENFVINASKKQYFPDDPAIISTRNLNQSASFERNFALTPIPSDKEFELEGIYYGLDSANIKAESAKILDKLILTLNSYPTVVIELASHTDCRGTYEYNIELSQRRADSCLQYLIDRGIDPERIVSKGYGESRLLIDKCSCEFGFGQGLNCTEAEHQMNRRTTIRILRTDFKKKN